MFLELIDEIIGCFEVAIANVEEVSFLQISPPTCLEDDEAEMFPLVENEYEFDYDDIPF